MKLNLFNSNIILVVNLFNKQNKMERCPHCNKPINIIINTHNSYDYDKDYNNMINSKYDYINNIYKPIEQDIYKIYKININTNIIREQ